MPRYFFNIYDGKEVFDREGTVLTGRKEVHLHMIALAKAWIELQQHQDSHWYLEARDENENKVGTMRFGVLPDDA